MDITSLKSNAIHTENKYKVKMMNPHSVNKTKSEDNSQ